MFYRRITPTVEVFNDWDGSIAQFRAELKFEFCVTDGTIKDHVMNVHAEAYGFSPDDAIKNAAERSVANMKYPDVEIRANDQGVPFYDKVPDLLYDCTAKEYQFWVSIFSDILKSQTT